MDSTSVFFFKFARQLGTRSSLFCSFALQIWTLLLVRYIPGRECGSWMSCLDLTALWMPYGICILMYIYGYVACGSHLVPLPLPLLWIISFQCFCLQFPISLLGLSMLCHWIFLLFRDMFRLCHSTTGPCSPAITAGYPDSNCSSLAVTVMVPSCSLLFTQTSAQFSAYPDLEGLGGISHGWSGTRGNFQASVSSIVSVRETFWHTSSWHRVNFLLSGQSHINSLCLKLWMLHIAAPFLVLTCVVSATSWMVSILLVPWLLLIQVPDLHFPNSPTFAVSLSLNSWLWSILQLSCNFRIAYTAEKLLGRTSN